MHFAKLASVAVACSTLFAMSAIAATISGKAFYDHDRSGSWTSGDAPMPTMRLYAFDGAGKYVGQATSDAQGVYAFGALAAGTYHVEYDATNWWALRRDWVPSTTGTLQPSVQVTLATSTSAVSVPFGWRAIVRSTLAGSPISAYVGPSGLKVESYDDVVPAKTVHDAVAQGLLGTPAQYTTIRFDLGTASTSSSSLSQLGATYVGYAAMSYVAYDTWLDGYDTVAGHEYGHAWSLYYAYIAQQDPTLSVYLQARGLQGDARLGTSHAWTAREILAEDYRQLFGSPTARVAGQENKDIPAAAQVPGLATFLQDTFTTPVAAPAPPPEAPTLAIHNLVVNPQAVTTLATIGFDVSAQASLTVDIRNGHGSVVRTLIQGLSVPASAQTFTWDRKDARGRKVKAGSYSVRVNAMGPDGQSVVQAQAFTVL